MDRILIAKETDPGWLALMMAARGIVVERGSLVSHTAISGRLLGVPTVVAVTDAMTAVPDGAWVEIDGDAGTVRPLTAAEAAQCEAAEAARRDADDADDADDAAHRKADDATASGRDHSDSAAPGRGDPDGTAPGHDGTTAARGEA